MPGSASILYCYIVMTITYELLDYTELFLYETNNVFC
jgi:hypothetical protein